MGFKNLTLIGTWLCLFIFQGSNAINVHVSDGYSTSKDSIKNPDPFLVAENFKIGTESGFDNLQKHTTIKKNEGPPMLENSTSSVQRDLVNYLFLIMALIGTLLAIKLIQHKKNGMHNIFLALFIVGISAMLVELSIYRYGDLNYQPKVYFFKILFFLWAPSLYLYNKKKLSVTTTTFKEMAMHYSLFFIFCIILLLFANTYDNNGPEMGSIHQILSALLQNYYIKAIHITLYLILLIRIYREQEPLLDMPYKRWHVVSIIFLGSIMLFMYSNALFGQTGTLGYVIKFLTILFISLFIFLCAIMFFIQPEIITSNDIQNDPEDKIKYKNSGLTDAMTETLKIELLELVENKKIYLDNTITLEKLALELNTDRYSLSQVINQELGKNFYEFINDYRIQEAIAIINQNRNSIKSITDLIYESGFNNKVSFYKAFKKRKKMTPTEYLKYIGQ